VSDKQAQNVTEGLEEVYILFWDAPDCCMYAVAKRSVHTTIDSTHLPFSDGTLSGSRLGLRPPSASVASHAARRPVFMPTTGCTARLLLLTLERLVSMNQRSECTFTVGDRCRVSWGRTRRTNAQVHIISGTNRICCRCRVFCCFLSKCVPGTKIKKIQKKPETMPVSGMYPSCQYQEINLELC